jgi:hypothetical protein
MTTSPTDPNLDQLQSAATLQEYRFRSQIPLVGPLIARFRELWNGVSTRWYVRPLIQQQSEFNKQIATLLATQAAALRAAASQRTQDEARLARHEEQLANTEARLAQCEERLIACEGHLGRQETRLHDQDGALIDEDREQTVMTHNLAETAARLIQLERSLAELDRRLADFETTTRGRPEPA